MGKKLFFSAIVKFALGAALVGVLLFLPAGTLLWPGGWLLMGLLFIPMFFAGVILMVKNPALLQSRLQAKESRREQDLVVRLSGLMFLAGFTLAGLDFRFGWSRLPEWLNATAAALFLLAYLLYAEVLRENTFLSRTVQVQAGQTVVDTGLYSIVRHPMYSATVLLFLTMPLILGSLPAFAVFLAYPFILTKRIQNEEQLLEQELQGYTAYKQKVRYRLLPYIW